MIANALTSSGLGTVSCRSDRYFASTTTKTFPNRKTTSGSARARRGQNQYSIIGTLCEDGEGMPNHLSKSFQSSAQKMAPNTVDVRASSSRCGSGLDSASLPCRSACNIACKFTSRSGQGGTLRWTLGSLHPSHLGINAGREDELNERMGYLEVTETAGELLVAPRR